MPPRLGLACVLLLVPLPASAGTPAEALLSRDSLAYFRYDGLSAHQKAYDQTALARVLDGDAGDFLRYLGTLARDGLGQGNVKDKMLSGATPDQLLRIHGAARHLPRLAQHLGRHGVVVGAEVISTLPPRAQLTVVFPQAGADPADRDAVFAGFQLALALNNVTPKAQTLAGRSAMLVTFNPLVRMVYWQEGEHVVCTVGTEPPQYTVGLMQGKRPNLTTRDLYREVAGFDRYETAFRGFVDVQ